MWGRRRKRGTRLSRHLSLGLLEDAMARAERQQEEAEPEPVPYPQASQSAPAVPPARPGLADEDVPVENSACPDPEAAGEDAGDDAREDAAPQRHQGFPAQRRPDSTRRGSFGRKNHS
jgi:hypothetical protein